MTPTTAVVLAGSRPGKDPFAESCGTDLKALIPILGEPMVRRPVEALLASPEVDGIRVLAQQQVRIRAALPNDPRVSVDASVDTIASTLEKDPTTNTNEDRRGTPSGGSRDGARGDTTAGRGAGIASDRAAGTVRRRDGKPRKL